MEIDSSSDSDLFASVDYDHDGSSLRVSTNGTTVPSTVPVPSVPSTVLAPSTAPVPSTVLVPLVPSTAPVPSTVPVPSVPSTVPVPCMFESNTSQCAYNPAAGYSTSFYYPFPPFPMDSSSMAAQYHYPYIPPPYPWGIQPLTIDDRENGHSPMLYPRQQDTATDPCTFSLPRTSIMSKLLQKGPEKKLPSIPPKQCGKVLTSNEHMQQLEIKKQKKIAEEKQKQERMKKRKQGVYFYIIYMYMYNIQVPISTLTIF